jgi:hypothetical protein
VRIWPSFSSIKINGQWAGEWRTYSASTTSAIARRALRLRLTGADRWPNVSSAIIAVSSLPAGRRHTVNRVHRGVRGTGNTEEYNGPDRACMTITRLIIKPRTDRRTVAFIQNTAFALRFGQTAIVLYTRMEDFASARYLLGDRSQVRFLPGSPKSPEDQANRRPLGSADSFSGAMPPKCLPRTAPDAKCTLGYGHMDQTGAYC